MILPLAEADALARAVVAEFANGEFAAVSQRFVAKVRALIPAEALQVAWKQITDEAGPFRGIVASQPEPAEDPELCLVISTCTFERGQLQACMLVDGEKQLNGLWFHAKPA